MKLKKAKSRKIHRIRHMEYMLQLAKRAKRVTNGDSVLLDFHVENYTRLLQVVQDNPE